MSYTRQWQKPFPSLPLLQKIYFGAPLFFISHPTALCNGVIEFREFNPFLAACKPPGARLIHALCPLIRMWHHRMSLEPVVPYTQCGIWSKAARLGTVQWYEYFKENVNMFCRDILYEICVLWWILNRLALTSVLEVYVPCRQSILLLYLIAFFVFLLLISKL